MTFLIWTGTADSMSRPLIYGPYTDPYTDPYYDFFDLDGNGRLDEQEFLEIGRAMHNDGAWNEERNADAFTSIDTDRNGTIDQNEFIAFYEEAICDSSDKKFERGIAMFLKSAKSVNLDKIEQGRLTVKKSA